jgi:predicted  nucleic acid-binding Zn-ribbon protein
LEVKLVSHKLVNALREYEALQDQIRSLEKQIEACEARKKQLRDDAEKELDSMGANNEFLLIGDELYEVLDRHPFFPLRRASYLNLDVES